MRQSLSPTDTKDRRVRAFRPSVAPLSSGRPGGKNRSHHPRSILLSKLSSALFTPIWRNGNRVLEERIKIAFRNSRPGNNVQHASGRKTGFGEQAKCGIEYTLADGSGGVCGGGIRCRLCFLNLRHFHLTKVRIGTISSSSVPYRTIN